MKMVMSQSHSSSLVAVAKRLALLILMLGIFQGNAVAQVSSTSQTGATGFKPHFYATLGLLSWRNYNEGTLSAVVDSILVQSDVPSSFTFDFATEATLSVGVGMRPMERWSIEFWLNGLPQANFSIGEPFQTESPDIEVLGKTRGWNSSVVVDYAIPIGGKGLKLVPSAGFSYSKIKVDRTIRPTDTSNTSRPSTVRASEVWDDPLLGLGLRAPFPFMSDRLEMSATYTRIFSDEESVRSTISAQVNYSFK